MQVYSTVSNSQLSNPDPIQQGTSQLYQKMNDEYVKNGFTYKSNQVLHKMSQKFPSTCPYDLLLHVSKIYHLNQFQIIFFTHILSETIPCYNEEPEIFSTGEHAIPTEVEQLINDIYQQSQDSHASKGFALEFLGAEDNMHHTQNQQSSQHAFTHEQLKKIYLYLLVIGYAIKYYLNEPIKAKPYEQHIKSILPNFMSLVFNKWARTYGNKVLSTTPRKINAYYMSLGFLQGDDEGNDQKQGDDCQYRNYNQIVEELIKATTEGEGEGAQVGGAEGDYQQE